VHAHNSIWNERCSAGNSIQDERRRGKRPWQALYRRTASSNHFRSGFLLALCIREMNNPNMPQEAPDKILEIKKYPNRRYYDATHSRHLTLEEIRSLIQQGYDIRVIDAKTSTDITAQLLTQIILELDTPKLDSLPVPLLVRIIRMNDQLVKDFIEKYFNQALKSFFDYQRQIEEQVRKTHGLPPLFPSVSAWTKAMLEPFSAAFSGSRPSQPAETQPPGTADKSEDLHKLVRELQKEVASLKEKPKTARGRAGRKK
jgi:polyhydroxyalkanoate synthesis repressor PhaR